MVLSHARGARIKGRSMRQLSSWTLPLVITFRFDYRPTIGFREWVNRCGEGSTDRGIPRWLEVRTVCLIFSVDTAAWTRFPRSDWGTSLRLAGQPTGYSPLSGSHRPWERRPGMNVSCKFFLWFVFCLLARFDLWAVHTRSRPRGSELQGRRAVFPSLILM